MEKIIEILEKNSIGVVDYKENDMLCGYELENWTVGGVNMIIFLDFRNAGDVTNPKDFINEFSSYMKDFDIEETIDIYREDKLYKDNLSLKQSLKDITDWKKEMLEIIDKCNIIEIK